MMGLMTLSWAWAETTLAMIIGLIVEYDGPIEGHPEAPVSMKGKLKFFRKALASSDTLKPLQQRGLVFAGRFTQLSGRRNDLVHGAAWQTHEGAFQSIGLKAAGAQYAPQNHTLDVEDAIGLNVEIGTLSDEITVFMLEIATLFERSAGGIHDANP